MKRNPAATCGNCPYFNDKNLGNLNIGYCCKNIPALLSDISESRWPEVGTAEWCGQHPDFWAVETEAEPDVAKCEPTPEPPTLEDVLAAYRQASIIANKYESDVCEECKWDDPKVCRTCAIWWEVKFQHKESTQ